MAEAIVGGGVSGALKGLGTKAAAHPFTLSSAYVDLQMLPPPTFLQEIILIDRDSVSLPSRQSNRIYASSLTASYLNICLTVAKASRPSCC